MNKLTDLEICKRIAKIEGVDANESLMQVGSCYIPTGRGLVDENFIQYNPITDDALCLRLIDKHNVSINTHFLNPSIKQCYIIRLVGFEMVTGKTFSINDLGLKKAACLAIIDSKA
jgi:hypothetical protein